MITGWRAQNGLLGAVCRICGAQDGTVRQKRCKGCRKAGAGGAGKLSAAKTRPPKKQKKIGKVSAAKAKPAPAAATEPEEKTGPVSHAWLDAFKAVIEKKPTLAGMWGVTATLKIIKAGGRPLYEKLPPALLKEVVE